MLANEVIEKVDYDEAVKENIGDREVKTGYVQSLQIT